MKTYKKEIKQTIKYQDALIEILNDLNYGDKQEFICSIIAKPDPDNNNEHTLLEIDKVFKNTLIPYTLPNGGAGDTFLADLQIKKTNVGRFFISRKPLGGGNNVGSIGHPNDVEYSVNNVVVFIQKGKGSFYDITAPSNHRVEAYYSREEGLIQLESVDSSGDYTDLILTDEEKFYPMFLKIEIYK